MHKNRKLTFGIVYKLFHAPFLNEWLDAERPGSKNLNWSTFNISDMFHMFRGYGFEHKRVIIVPRCVWDFFFVLNIIFIVNTNLSRFFFTKPVVFLFLCVFNGNFRLLSDLCCESLIEYCMDNPKYSLQGYYVFISI